MSNNPDGFDEMAAAFEGSAASRMLDPHQILSEVQSLARILHPDQPLSQVTTDKAAQLIKDFGSLAGVLNASALELNKTDVDLATFHMFKAVNAAMLHVLQANITKGTPINSWSKTIEYLTASMAHEKTEKIKILFLDRKNNLIADENQGIGTIDHVPVYPREIAKRCLELNATAIILVHNHPSGDPTPSDADISMTQQVIEACKAINVTVHDHIIIGHNQQNVSFKALGHL